MIATDGIRTIANAPALADFAVHHDGSVSLVQPLTAAGKAWIEENVDTDGAQYLGRWLGVDHRYIYDLLDGIFDAGLTVE
jgi:hypothetical protein